MNPERRGLAPIDRTILIVLVVLVASFLLLIWMGAGLDIESLSHSQDDMEAQSVRLDAREQMTANTITGLLVDVRQRLERIDAKMSE